MTRFMKTAAVLAATGLMLAQPAAATARTAASTGDSEALAGTPPGSTAVIGLIAALGLVFVIMAITDGDDNDDVPTSP